MNKTGLSIDPWDTSPVTGLQGDYAITFWAQLFVLSSSPYFVRIVWDTVSKVLLQFWYTVSTALPSSYQASHFITEVYQLLLGESMLIIPDDLPVLQAHVNGF